MRREVGTSMGCVRGVSSVTTCSKCSALLDSRCVTPPQSQRCQSVCHNARVATAVPTNRTDRVEEDDGKEVGVVGHDAVGGQQQ
jgi:hypothetical protein